MIARAAVAVGIAAGAVIVSFRRFYEPDLWWHLAQGRETLSGHIVRSNLFSFTVPDYPQHFTSWLFDVSAVLAWSAGGAAAIQLLQALWIGTALALVAVACRVRSGGAAAFAVLAVGLFIVEPRAIPRPHVISFAGIAFCALLVERAVARRSASPLVWAPPAIALWSNFHVEAAFGASFVALFAAAELTRPSALPRPEGRRAAVVAALCALATLATPYGTGVLRYLYENWTLPQTITIAELRPPYLPAYRAFFTFVVGGALLLVAQSRNLRLWEAIVFAVFAALGVRYLRLTPLVFFAAAPMIAARVAALIARGIDPRAVVVTSAAVAALVTRLPHAALVSELRFGGDALEPPSFFSRDAIAYARANGLRGPLFNSHNLGGYLAWCLYPDARVFQDSRLQAYPPGYFGAIIGASRSQADWNALVAPVEWGMLSVPRPNELSGAGRFPPTDWATVFRDQAVEIVVRRGSPPAPAR